MTKLILVVDDSAVYQRVARLILEDAGYRVESARDGIEALEFIEREIPDLITCDIMMPRLDGLATLRALRLDPRTRSVPIYMLTTVGDQEYIDEASAAGADGYVTKPFEAETLVEIAQRHLGKLSK